MADPFILYNILFYHQKRNFLSVEIAGVAYLKYFLTISSNYQNFLDSLIFFKWKKKKKLLSENSSFFPRPIILQSSNFVSRNSCPPGRASGWRHYDFNYRGNRTPVRKTFFLFFFSPVETVPWISIEEKSLESLVTSNVPGILVTVTFLKIDLETWLDVFRSWLGRYP